MENEDALHDDHRGRLNEHCFLRAVVIRVGVHRTVDGAARLQLLELADHEAGIKGIGVVVILLAALLKGDILALIVIIVVHDADGRAEVGGQMVGEGSFAAAGASGDADDHGVHKRCPPAVIFLPL